MKALRFGLVFLISSLFWTHTRTSGTHILEAQNFFDFPLGEARPFYIRRIGIFEDQDTPIIGGARFPGRMGRSTLGAMVLETEKTDISAATNFSLVRWKQDILEQSSIGVLAVGAAQAGRFNGTGGVDALYSTSRLFGNKNFQFGGAIAATYTSDREARAGGRPGSFPPGLAVPGQLE